MKDINIEIDLIKNIKFTKFRKELDKLKANYNIHEPEIEKLKLYLKEEISLLKNDLSTKSSFLEDNLNNKLKEHSNINLEQEHIKYN